MSRAASIIISAYTKPRKLLDKWVQQVISTCREDPEQTVISSLNSMRGWLDDSMINFLSGDYNTISVIDRKTGKKSIKLKECLKAAGNTYPCARHLG